MTFHPLFPSSFSSHLFFLNRRFDIFTKEENGGGGKLKRGHSCVTSQARSTQYVSFQHFSHFRERLLTEPLLLQLKAESAMFTISAMSCPKVLSLFVTPGEGVG